MLPRWLNRTCPRCSCSGSRGFARNKDCWESLLSVCWVAVAFRITSLLFSRELVSAHETVVAELGVGVSVSGFLRLAEQRPRIVECTPFGSRCPSCRLKVLVQASFAEIALIAASTAVPRDLTRDRDRASSSRSAGSGVIRLMQENGLKARTRKRFTLTTMSGSRSGSLVGSRISSASTGQFEAAAGVISADVGDTTELCRHRL